MSDTINDFIGKKKDESVFVALQDGESVTVLRLREIKIVNKLGFGGEEKEVLRLVVDVDTQTGIRTKTFDNGTQKFAQELQEKKVSIGSSFTITRTGMQTKTRYNISNVVASTSPAEAPVAPAPQSAPNSDAIDVNNIPM